MVIEALDSHAVIVYSIRGRVGSIQRRIECRTISEVLTQRLCTVPARWAGRSLGFPRDNRVFGRTPSRRLARSSGPSRMGAERSMRNAFGILESQAELSNELRTAN